MAAARTAALLAIIGFSAGCASSQPSAAAPASRSVVVSHMAAASLAFSQCARRHGLPNLPDPQIDDNGDLHYPPGAIPAGGYPASVIDGCSSQWAVFHQWRDQLDQINAHNRSHMTAAQVQQEIRSAQCIRQHGFPGFPDPDPDGSYPTGSLPPGWDKQNPSPQAQAAMQACLSAK